MAKELKTTLKDKDEVEYFNGRANRLTPRSVAGDYTVNVENDQVLLVDTSLGDITITLPLSTSINNDGRVRELRIQKVTTDVNEVTIQLSGSETFILGNTKVVLSFASKTILLGAKYGQYAINTEIEALSKVGINTWDASNFSSLATVPFDDVIKVAQDEFISYDTSTYKFTILSRGEYNCSAMFAIDSTGGSTYVVYAYIYINGVEAPYTKIRTGNYGGEDQMMTGITWNVELNAGDEVEVKMEHSNLTGNLDFGIFAIKTKVG